MDVPVDWTAVRERVIAVKEAGRRAVGLGPSPYPLFETALTPAEIAEVETQYGAELPGEYRSFLAEVGAGGPGPEHALTSLRRIDGSWGWVADDDEEHPWLPDTGGPFVETEGWAEWQLATLRAAGHEPAARDGDCDYLPDYRKAFGAAGDELWHLERGRGAVQIGDNGCGATGWLVLVGPRRGELRHRDCAVNPPYEPFVDAQGRPHTFGTWYLEWLERCEREVREAGLGATGC
ncbi:SMI1/KNR4 family protein [Kitasatospora sp. NPDC036755]|uniref:SMI1/KNR4 family protein n=1 Tax=Kitasatospora sp. NPDC036755 TaxID=3154600 RepID=UPI0033F9C781